MPYYFLKLTFFFSFCLSSFHPILMLLSLFIRLISIIIILCYLSIMYYGNMTLIILGGMLIISMHMMSLCPNLKMGSYKKLSVSFTMMLIQVPYKMCIKK